MISVCDRRPASGEDSFEQYQSALLAAALTAAPAETEADLEMLRRIEDRELKQSRGYAMLYRLEQHRRRLRARLDPTEPHTARVLAAATIGDQAALLQLGIDLTYSWTDDVLAALVNGAPFVEFETVGPYAQHHVDEAGTLRFTPDRLSPDEVGGILLAAVIRDMAADCGNVRPVFLVDDRAETPTGEAVPEWQRDQFLIDLGRALYDHGVLREGDQPGKDYVLIREEEQADRLPELIRRLGESGNGRVATSAAGDIVFHPTDELVEKLALRSDSRRREFRRRGIALVRRGHPTCHALDATTFLHPQNSKIVHMVVLDQRFRSEQDKTYALVRAIDMVSQDRYHNMFFDPAALSPELFTYAVILIFQYELRRFLRSLASIDGWERFDTQEYVDRNFPPAVRREDAAIMRYVAEQFREAGVHAARVADVSAGPNLYPSMLIAPYLDEAAELDMFEFTGTNRTYLRNALAGGDADRWESFEARLVDTGGERYRGALDTVRRRGRVVAGTVADLCPASYDVALAYFSTESMTFSRAEFREAIRLLAASVRPGGLVTTAHMVGSRGWQAGSGTRFPAVMLSITDIVEAYRDADLSFVLHTVDEPEDRVREGYDGMAVVIARRTR